MFTWGRCCWRVFTSLLLLLPAVTRAQDRGARIDALMARYFAAGQFNGSVLVAERGRVIYSKGFGLANFEWSVPNAPDTRFRIGSITKAFTTILVLQLVEQGKLRMDGRISDYLPDFAGDRGNRITIEQLLTHMSGLPDYNNVPDFFRAVQSGLLSDDEILKRIGEYDLLFEPGSRFGYSNDGYRVLGAIVERIAGKPYARLLQDNILDPLGMKATGFSSRSALVNKRASGYRTRPSGIENAPYYEASAASGMYSTVEDLFRFDQALYLNTVLLARSKELMWQIVPSGNAYGWHVSRMPGGNDRLKVMTEGAVYGFFARLVRLPQERRTIILLTNVRGPANFLPEIEAALFGALGTPSESLKR